MNHKTIIFCEVSNDKKKNYLGLDIFDKFTYNHYIATYMFALITFLNVKPKN